MSIFIFLRRNKYFTVHYGSESLVSLAPKIWELVPDSTREVKTLSIFKNRNDIILFNSWSRKKKVYKVNMYCMFFFSFS